jgi:hypothetical protein
MGYREREHNGDGEIWGKTERETKINEEAPGEKVYQSRRYTSLECIPV